jgi:hypothetical protein
VKSVYDELREKAERGTSPTRRNGPKIDIGLLLMNYRDDLRAAVEKLRPFYAERP